MQNKLVIRLTLMACLLAFCVVILGAYTRLTDAGLGCPDWPTCYHHLTVPKDQETIQKAELRYPGFPLNSGKAWTEMIHRYAASTLGLFIFALILIAITKRQGLRLPLTLGALVIFQALLGMWTVTLRLNPLVVMSHLLGGFALLSLLWVYFLRESSVPERDTMHAVSPKLLYFGVLGLIILLLQISLGGWTSANHAALACPNFPACITHQFFPQMNFPVAFNLLNSAVIHLSYAALVTIHMMHRFGALITASYLAFLGLYLICLQTNKSLKKLAVFLLLVLLLQISFGIMNVILYLPLSVAVLHNAGAALLLLSLVTINFYLCKQSKI